MSTAQTSQTALSAQRSHLERQGFLSPADPGDALAVYYTLHHDPARTQLWLNFDAARHVDGLVAVCQTGFNLFQPTVVLRAANARVAVSLLRQALHPGRPYYIVTTPALAPALPVVMRLGQEQVNYIYLFDPRRHTPEINVLVQPGRSVDGSPRFVIRSQEQAAAEAGVNWRSPYFAEMFVRTQPQARGRGWGKAVAAACATALHQLGVQVLYAVGPANRASVYLAAATGFVDSGARELAGQGVCYEEKAPGRA